MNFILQYIDLLWLPLGWVAVRPQQRWIVLIFMITCMFMARMQTELMNAIEYPTGILDFTSIPVLGRAIIIYSFAYMFYLVFLHYMPKNSGSILMASAIGVFFMAFFTSSMVMLL